MLEENRGRVAVRVVEEQTKQKCSRGATQCKQKKHVLGGIV